jgi:hypothetical protein
VAAELLELCCPSCQRPRRRHRNSVTACPSSESDCTEQPDLGPDSRS